MESLHERSRRLRETAILLCERSDAVIARGRQLRAPASPPWCGGPPWSEERTLIHRAEEAAALERRGEILAGSPPGLARRLGLLSA